MEINKVIELFNSYNGKIANKAELIARLKRTQNADLNKVIDLINNDEAREAEGSHKMCVHFGDEKCNYAFLKSFKKYSVADQQDFNELADTIINENEKLISLGALIPQIKALFCLDGHRIEVQESSRGDILAVLNLEGFSRRLLGCDGLDTPLKLRTEFKKQLYEHNLKQQKLMISLPQEKFNDLYKTYQILNDNYYGDYDSHCENVLVSESGFMIVDIDYDLMILNNVKSDKQTLFSRFVRPFSNTTAFKQYLTPEQIEVLQHNNVEILKKLVTCASLDGLALYNNPQFITDIGYKMVGEQNWKKYQGYILSSQSSLIKQSYRSVRKP